MRPLILLAAGQSSRMGEPKGLVPFEGKTWLEKQLEDFSKAGGTEVTVVLGFEKEKYLERLPILKNSPSVWNGLKIKAAVNPRPEEGQFSSLQAGLRETNLGNGVFVLPVDVPAASPEIWKKLEAAAAGEVEAAIPEHDGKGGHPACLQESFAGWLLSVSPVHGRLDRLMHELPDHHLARIPVSDAKIEMNLNTPEDISGIRTK